MHTMKLLVLLASICLEMQPIFAEEVNSLFHYISKRAPNDNCEKTVSECMKSNSQLVKSCKVCGLINTGDKPIIISGNTVYPQNRYPWMVSLMANGKHFCGGSIISDSYILTAAHCLKSAKNIEVEVGFLSPTSRVTSGYPVERTIIHPRYIKNDSNHFDFALIKLKQKITCGEYKNPVCLPPANSKLPLKTALTLTGWGWFSHYKNDTAKRLLEAEAYVIDLKACGRQSNRVDLYCLQGESGKVACKGDSGGPANYQRNKKYFCVGVASFVFGKCDTERPNGYARVDTVIDWITEITGVRPENF